MTICVIGVRTDIASFHCCSVMTVIGILEMVDGDIVFGYG